MDNVESNKAASINHLVCEPSSTSQHPPNIINDCDSQAGPSRSGLNQDENNLTHDSRIDKKYRVNKIDVTGYPYYTDVDELLGVFNKYGKPTIENITSKIATISFSSPDEASAAIKESNKVSLHGKRLKILPFVDERNDRAGLNNSKKEVRPKVTNKRGFMRTHQKSLILKPSEIDLSGNFLNQLHNILFAICLTQDEVEKLNILYNDVEEVLQAAWPGCLTVPFGSITTGLGIKTSDADCFVYLPPAQKQPGDLYVNKAKKILSNYPHVFTEILSIPGANTPIVKFFHLPAEVNCDLSFKTLLGTRNSSLISFLLQADPRLLPMSIFIKYWAKVHEFSGSGKLTNYALTMMVIFFLQQPPYSILPPVASLQKNPQYEFVVDFWNTGFVNKRELLPAIANKSPISELIGDFFNYYANFPFEKIICPYLGYPVDRVLFTNVEMLPEEFELYKYNTINRNTLPLNIKSPMCIQDPFEQSHNVASGVLNRNFLEIKAYFRHASKIYQSELENDCNEFLKKVLLEKPLDLPKKKPTRDIKITLPPKFICKINDPDWIKVVKKIIYILFNDMLKLDLEDFDTKHNMAKKVIREKYKGKLAGPIWRRKQFTKFYSVSRMDFARKEEKISEEIIATNNFSPCVPIQLTAVYHNYQKYVDIFVKPTEGQNDKFTEFGKFLYSIQGWFIRLFRMSLNDQNFGNRGSECVNGEPSENDDLNINIMNNTNINNVEDDKDASETDFESAEDIESDRDTEKEEET